MGERAGDSAWSTGLSLAIVLASVAFVHAVWWLVGDGVVVHGNLADSDGYARLVRVLRLVETGGWFDSSLPRANWPDGGSLHWTRPLDVILIALALPITAVTGFATALYWAGVFVSPLLHGLLAVAVMWAARPLLSSPGAVIAGVLTALQFGILGYATIGHADHHVLIGLISALAIGLTLRVLTMAEEDAAGRHALALGGVLAAGIWVGTEVQVTAGFCLGVLGLRWAFEGEAWLERNRRLALGLVLGLAAALVVERGAGFFDVQYDRISFVHLSLAALLLAFWGCVGALGIRLSSIPSRLGAGIAGDVVIIAVMAAVFPKVLVSPLKDADPVLLGIFDAVAEYAPMSDASHFLVYAGAVLIALPWAAWRVGEDWPRSKSWAWLLIAAALAVYTVFAVNWVRWSLYVGLVSPIAVAGLMVWADGAITRRFASPARMPVKAAAFLLLAVGPFAIGMAGIIGTVGAGGAGGGQAAEVATGGDPRPCPVQAAAGFLNKPPWGEKPRTILTSANDGAEILYRTRHRVIGTLHHPNAKAILDSVRIFGGEGGAETLALIQKRQIDLVLVCLGTRGEAYRRDGEKTGLFHRLKAGAAPAWLDEIPLPAALGRAFRLYKVAAP